MLSRFFIDRPIFAWVIAIVIMLAGALAIVRLPVEQYPEHRAAQVDHPDAPIPARRPKTVENTVTQVIEQQLTGIDGLLYFASTTSSRGQVADHRDVRAGHQPRHRPGAGAEQGAAGDAAAAAGGAAAGRRACTKSQLELSADRRRLRHDGPLQQRRHLRLSRQPTCRTRSRACPASATSRCSARRTRCASGSIPYKLASYSLMPGDVRDAIARRTPRSRPARSARSRPPPGQKLNATVTAQSRLTHARAVPQHHPQDRPSGARRAAQRRRARRARRRQLPGHQPPERPTRARHAVRLAPGANALTTIDAVKASARRSSRPRCPKAWSSSFPVDNTRFIRSRSRRSIKTLIEAIVLVILVMFVFLQNWRATLIPAIAVPVVLLGTFGVLAVFGYSINTLTLFALVLAIGLLVDDAIVVVENVERMMREERLSPREATLKSMDQITGALVAIALVLSAVFLPMAFFGGSTGVIYRQFSVTIVSAMVLSVFVALVLTPALCATLLQAGARRDATRTHGWFFSAVQPQRSTAGRERYERACGAACSALRRSPMLVYGVIVALMAVLFCAPADRLPAARGPGRLFTPFTLPAGATQSRTLEVAKQVEHFYLDRRKSERRLDLHVAGFSFAGSGQNTGQAFVNLKHWDERPGKDNSAEAIVGRAMQTFSNIRDAQVFALMPPPIRGLGNSTGFDMQLQDRGDLGHEALMAARDQLLEPRRARTRCSRRCGRTASTTRRSSTSTSTSKGHRARHLRSRDINATLSAAWGGAYVNDFIDRGRVKRVYMQGDAPFRMPPEDLDRWYVRRRNRRDGAVLVVHELALATGTRAAQRYNGRPAIQHSGAAARPASAPATRWTRWSGSSRSCRGSASPGPALSYQERLSRRAGAAAVRDLAAGRVPVPRRAVRELVGAGRGAARGAARHGRRGARGDAARARRTTSTSRSACSRRWASRRRTRS